jgi:tRNA splicing endonuclease
MQVRVVATNGPLFVLDESAEMVCFFSAQYPQFAKRSLGWQLSVEEIACLQSSAPTVEVVFVSADAAELYSELRQAYAVDCAVYRQLTLHHGYKLRHGSPFGANYIGYRDLKAHGEYLFFIGPLADLEELRAVRVAHSVRKIAVRVAMAADEAGVTLICLGCDHGATAAPQPKKRHRKG